MGEETWQAGMNRPMPDDGGDVLDNPYTYTDYKSDETREARGSLFGS